MSHTSPAWAPPMRSQITSLSSVERGCCSTAGFLITRVFFDFLSGISSVLVPIQQPRRHRKWQRLWQLERAERCRQRPVRSRRVPLHRQQPQKEAEQIWLVPLHYSWIWRKHPHQWRAYCSACVWSPVVLCLFPWMDSCGALPQQQQLHGLHLLTNWQQRLQPELFFERLRPAWAVQQPGLGEVYRRLPAAGGRVDWERRFCMVRTSAVWIF